jgi:hypothetical protein
LYGRVPGMKLDLPPKSQRLNPARDLYSCWHCLFVFATRAKTGTYNISLLSYYLPFSVFGRSANAVASLPWAVGTFQGMSVTPQSVYRRGV